MMFQALPRTCRCSLVRRLRILVLRVQLREGRLLAGREWMGSICWLISEGVALLSMVGEVRLGSFVVEEGVPGQAEGAVRLVLGPVHRFLLL